MAAVLRMVFFYARFLSSEMGLEISTFKSLQVYSEKSVCGLKTTEKRLRYSKNRAPKGVFELLAAVL